ncbi:tetratricopeptide repeat protein [Amycolatopsis sp. NPDC051716]|uniref:ATP-binding protein n=1 Tax=Amycolatopsis sp. NPDC051716 TaxID=3155804 RepID=UPI00343689B6
MVVPRADRAFVVPPDPGRAGSLDELIDVLRSLKTWAGEPSYETIKDRVNTAWLANGRPPAELTGKTTVADCFRTGRRRVNADLVIAVAAALHPDAGYVTQWRQALRVIGGQARAGSQVRVESRLPADPPGFTGRAGELERLRRTGAEGGAVTITGLAGVGKSRLAVRAGHLLIQDGLVDQVLFVNLRGVHPDPAQPPAEPAAVLDGFLRVLGVSGQQIPYDLAARAAAYRARLAGTRTLVVLDNAADAEHARLLLPGTPGCPVLITSRRDLTDLRPATHLTVDVFTPEEAAAFVAGAVAGVPDGGDPRAAVRIARRCGHLPLALGLVTGHIRGRSGWTLTDHADRLDERHQDRRLDTGVELAFDLSYRNLPTGEQRLLRLAALHPGQDFDVHAAAALAGCDLPAVQVLLERLCLEHLLQQEVPGRYTLHDLVRAYAAGRAGDHDPPPERRAALTRLFDFYLATATAAMDTLHPAETNRRPRTDRPGTPVPELTEPDRARAWLDAERFALVAVTAHTAAHGWPSHTARLSTTLFRYLSGGYFADALAVFGHARDAARHAHDPQAEAHALTSLAVIETSLSRYRPAAGLLRRALQQFRQAGDQAGEARALTNLGVVEGILGHNQPAADHYTEAVALFQRAGHRTGEAHALNNLGDVESRLGRTGQATEHFARALALFRQLDDHTGEAWTLTCLGQVEVRMGRYGEASDHLQQALVQYRQLANPVGEAWTLNYLGTLHTRAGRDTGQHQQAIALFREIGDRRGEASALNGLGEAAHTTGRPADALAHHSAANAIAADLGLREQQARAHAGLGNAHRAQGRAGRARSHYRRALDAYTDLGMPEADEIRTHLAADEKRSRTTLADRTR